MTTEEYKKQFTEDDTPGWQAIDDQLEKVYGNIEPRHYPPLCGIHYAIGGEDPIDGASIYDSSKQVFHRHIVSYGMSNLYYDEEAAGSEFSNWGFEFTFRLAPFKEDQDDPIWVIQLMNNLARYVHSSGRWFEENQLIPAGGPIRLNTETEITGLAVALDPELGKIQTPHGEVSFLQLVGLTTAEVDLLQKNLSQEAVKEVITILQHDNPLLITDLYRK